MAGAIAPLADDMAIRVKRLHIIASAGILKVKSASRKGLVEKPGLPAERACRLGPYPSFYFARIDNLERCDQDTDVDRFVAKGKAKMRRHRIPRSVGPRVEFKNAAAVVFGPPCPWDDIALDGRGRHGKPKRLPQPGVADRAGTIIRS